MVFSMKLVNKDKDEFTIGLGNYIFGDKSNYTLAEIIKGATAERLNTETLFNTELRMVT